MHSSIGERRYIGLRVFQLTRFPFLAEIRTEEGIFCRWVVRDGFIVNAKAE